MICENVDMLHHVLYRFLRIQTIQLVQKTEQLTQEANCLHKTKLCIFKSVAAANLTIVLIHDICSCI